MRSMQIPFAAELFPRCVEAHSLVHSYPDSGNPESNVVAARIARISREHIPSDHIVLSLLYNPFY